MKPNSIQSVTLARSTPSEFKVTYWNDGVARFDGTTGPRQGAWNALCDRNWFPRIARLLKTIESGLVRTGQLATTLVVESDSGQFIFEAAQDDEPPNFWMISTLIEGMVQRTRWVPLDATGKHDLAALAEGRPLWMDIGDVSAAALAGADGLLVLAGSHASTTTSESLPDVYRDQRTTHIEDGTFLLAEDRFILSRHVLFPSPSAAAAVLGGSSINGRNAWKDSGGRPWSALGLD